MEKIKIEQTDKIKLYVLDKFNIIDFDINKFPELLQRLTELASLPESHFDDAVKMSEIVDIIWHDIEKSKEITLNKEEVKLACLFHDIGKSGPVEADEEQRSLIQEIFNPQAFNINSDNFQNSPEFKNKSQAEQKKTIKDLPIHRVLEIENLDNTEQINDYLQTLELHVFDSKTKKINKEKLDLDKYSMIDLWREHDYWTYDLLKKYADDQISQDLIIVASSHHTLEGHDPALVDGAIPQEAVALETIDKYLIITLLDKYQAFIDRSGKNHQDTVQILAAMVQSSFDDQVIGRRQYELFREYLEIVEKHPEIADVIKKQTA